MVNHLCAPLFTTHGQHREQEAVSRWQYSKDIHVIGHSRGPGVCEWLLMRRCHRKLTAQTVHGVGWIRKVINVSHDYS